MYRRKFSISSKFNDDQKMTLEKIFMFLKQTLFYFSAYHFDRCSFWNENVILYVTLYSYSFSLYRFN